MCGIIAVFSLGAPVDREAAAAGLDALAHRGPDGRGLWIDPDARIALGHRRLSIIAPQHGAQPLLDDAGRVAVVNGEIYDFESLRRDLENHGSRFKTGSDSEVALHLYARYGSGCLRFLRGELALALWDAPGRLLFAARDRFGIKPLYYAVHDRRLFLASELKALFAAGVPARWDEETYRDRGFFLRDRTLFAGVHQVPPGHFLIADHGGIRLHRYWDIPYPARGRGETTVDPEELARRLRHELCDAVRLRLRSDVPVAVYLSGGLDSASVLGLTAELHDGPVDAFSLAFDDPFAAAGESVFDESAAAAETAARVGCSMHELRLGPRDLADAFEDAVFHAETVSINAHGTAKYLLSRYVRDAGFKVVLTGEGADEVFAGYAPFRQDMLRHNPEGQDPETLRSMMEQLRADNQVSAIMMADDDAGLPRLRRVLGFEPAALTSLIPWMAGLSNLTRAAFGNLDAAYMVDHLLAHLGDPERLRAMEPVHAAMYLWSKTFLANYILTNLGDRMEMAHSVEGRLPFLDHHLVETVAEWPVHVKIKGLHEKYILREAMRDLIPESVYRRQKHPFSSPPATSQIGGPMMTLIRDIVASRAMADQPFYDPAKVSAFIDKLPSLPEERRLDADIMLLEIACLATLQRHFAPTA